MKLRGTFLPEFILNILTRNIFV